MIIYARSQGFPRKYTAHLPGNGEIEVPEGATVKAVFDRLGVPEGEKKVIFVNGRHRTVQHILNPGDVLVFFPPLEGG